MNDAAASKRAAALHAAQLVKPGSVVGLGTGSTSTLFVEALSERMKTEGFAITGVPTSSVTARRAAELGITVITEGETWPAIDLAVDGADEVDPESALIKGGGGALLREKLVAAAAHQFVVIVDAAKHVPFLGATFKLPVEIVSFGWSSTITRLNRLMLQPVLRQAGGAPFRTDQGNLIVDCTLDRSTSTDPAALHDRIKRVTGVVETGLFVGMVDLVITGHPDGHASERPVTRAAH